MTDCCCREKVQLERMTGELFGCRLEVLFIVPYIDIIMVSSWIANDTWENVTHL